MKCPYQLKTFAMLPLFVVGIGIAVPAQGVTVKLEAPPDNLQKAEAEANWGAVDFRALFSAESEAKKATDEFQEQANAVIEELNEDLKALLADRNKTLTDLKTALLAHIEAQLKAAQEGGDLDAYERFQNYKEGLSDLNTWEELAYLARNFRIPRRGWVSDDVRPLFDVIYRNGVPKTSLKERYGTASEHLCQVADTRLADLEKKVLQSGNLEIARAIRARRGTIRGTKREWYRCLVEGDDTPREFQGINL